MNAHVEPSVTANETGWRRSHLGRRELLHVHTALAVEGGDATVLLEVAAVGSELDESDRHETRAHTRLLLEQSRVERLGVLPHLG